jgi:hypothetical protein
LSAIDLAIARVITDAISDDGYLLDDLEDIRASLLPEIECRSPRTSSACSRIVQSLGARRRRCAQLERVHRAAAAPARPGTPARDIAIRVALEHLDLVAGQQLVLLRRQLRCSEGDLEMALALVRSCHPRPGSAVSSGQAEYVIPDVFVRRTEHGWIVEVNQATVPRVRVNQTYANLISRVPGPRDAAHAAAGSALADAQPRDPQRDADQGGPLHRAAPGELFRARRGGDGAADPQGRRGGRGNARVDDIARHDRQVHAHAARRIRVPIFFLEPRRGGGRHRNVLDRDTRQDQAN